MRLVIPPADVVKKLHEVVFGVIESNKNANQRRIRTLTQLRDILLPRLISGQLRLPEAEAQIEAVCA
jgi:type I restriction enzyme S subunit